MTFIICMINAPVFFVEGNQKSVGIPIMERINMMSLKSFQFIGSAFRALNSL